MYLHTSTYIYTANSYKSRRGSYNGCY